MNKPAAHIYHVTSAHPAGDVRIFQRQVRSMCGKGYIVTLVAPAADFSALPKIPGISLVEFPKGDGRFSRILLASPRLVRLLWSQSADLIHLHDPELIPGGLFLRLFGHRVVFDAHEFLPDQVMAKTYLPVPLRKPFSTLLRWMLNLVFPLFSGIVAATEPIARRCRNRRVALVRNYPDIDGDLASLTDQAGKNQGEILYLGGLARARGLFDMLDAAMGIHAKTGRKIQLVGWFDSAATKAEAEAHPGWQYCTYHGRADREGVGAALGRAAIGLLPLHPTPAYRDALPVKLFEYMAAGLAVVAPEGHQWGEIVTATECGVIYEATDKNSLADTVIECVADPEITEIQGQNGRQAVENKYNWRTEAESLENLYGGILDG